MIKYRKERKTCVKCTSKRGDNYNEMRQENKNGLMAIFIPVSDISYSD